MTTHVLFRTRIILFWLTLLTCLAAQDSRDISKSKTNSVLNYFTTGFKSVYSDPMNRWIMGLTTTGTVVALPYDQQVKRYAQKYGLIPADLSRFGDLYGGKWAHWVLFSAILGNRVLHALPRIEMYYQFQYALVALAVNGALTAGLKLAVGRERPNGAGNRSFPSGHTSHSFVVAAVADELFGPKVGIPAYLIGGLVAVHRIHDNKHYLSDVIFGAGMGTIVGRGFAYSYREANPRFSVIPNLNGGVTLTYLF